MQPKYLKWAKKKKKKCKENHPLKWQNPIATTLALINDNPQCFKKDSLLSRTYSFKSPPGMAQVCRGKGATKSPRRRKNAEDGIPRCFRIFGEASRPLLLFHSFNTHPGGPHPSMTEISLHRNEAKDSCESTHGVTCHPFQQTFPSAPHELLVEIHR